MGGFCGKILKVDVSSEKIKIVTLKEAFYKKWLGGYGLGSRMLYDEIPPRTDKA